MFERFTERARQVIVLAQDEARGLRHGYIGTEHILLGLIREEEGCAARVLRDLGIGEVSARSDLLRIVGRGSPTERVPKDEIPYTPRAKKVLEWALREALSLGHNYIGTEHILLGLVREGEGVAARLLRDYLSHPADDIREAVLAYYKPKPVPIDQDDVDWLDVPTLRRVVAMLREDVAFTNAYIEGLHRDTVGEERIRSICARME